MLGPYKHLLLCLYSSEKRVYFVIWGVLVGCGWKRKSSRKDSTFLAKNFECLLKRAIVKYFATRHICVAVVGRNMHVVQCSTSTSTSKKKETKIKKNKTESQDLFMSFIFPFLFLLVGVTCVTVRCLKTCTIHKNFFFKNQRVHCSLTYSQFKKVLK